MPKAAQRQFLATVENIGGPTYYFSSKGGGDVSADTTKVYDGGRLRPELLASPAEADNITLTKPYDPQRDSALLAQLRQEVGKRIGTITIQQTDRNLTPIGKPVVYPAALLVGLTEPEFDASSGDSASFELEFAIGEFA